MYLRRRLGLLLVVIGLLLIGIVAPVGASSPNISHAYQTTNSIANGNLVSFVAGRSNFVELANTANGDRLVGVAVISKDSLVAIGAGANKVQVATSGTTVALASTVNGDINVGDQVAVSPFSGFGMKAGPGSRIIGVAQSKLSGGADGVQAREVTNEKGQKQSVAFGSVRVLVNVGSSTTSGGQNLGALQRFVRSLTGRTVSTLRIVISLVIALVSLAALITLVYGSIYGSIIAVGRNPLARKSILKTLVAVMAMALLIGIVASLAIFFLLR